MLFDLVIVFAAIFVTAIAARYTNLPITALEIIAGMSLAYFVSFAVPTSIGALVSLGSLLIVFLAGYETGFGFLKLNFNKALVIGLCTFFVPFVAILFTLLEIVHAPLVIALIGSAALSDVSISIVYTTLQQYEMVGLQIGRLILAGTLMVNIIEDTTVTVISLANAQSILFTSAILGLMFGGAIVLPLFLQKIEDRYPRIFSSIPTRFVLLSLAVMSALSTLAGVPGILFIFLMGLMYSRNVQRQKLNGNGKTLQNSQSVTPKSSNTDHAKTDEPFLDKVTNFAFAAFIPLYFLAVGLNVRFNFVLENLPILLGIIAVATAFRVMGVYGPARRYFGRIQARPVAVLFNTRLTSATVILLLSLSLNIITDAWYSLFISAVVIMALFSSLVLRAFPEFSSVQAAKEAFSTKEELNLTDKKVR